MCSSLSFFQVLGDSQVFFLLDLYKHNLSMMDPSPLIVLLLFCFFAGQGVVLSTENSDPSSRITVVGVVYCDTCSVNTFSRKSYFLPDEEVHIMCRFKANSPETTEEVNISVNRTTDKNGVYKLEIPHVDGVDCVDGIALASQCQANLIKNTAETCNIPVVRTSTNEISVKSKQDKLCIYSLSALSYKPSIKDNTLCGKQNQQGAEEAEKIVNESKFFWPYFPPYWFPWPSPSLPPSPNLPFPRLPFTNPPPTLPFPFPTLPPFPIASPPPPPAFDWRNPRTWIPYLPPFPPTNTLQNQEP